MVFDFVILAVACTALLKHPAQTSLWRMIFVDGLIYFTSKPFMHCLLPLGSHANERGSVAFTGYLICAVFAYLNLDVTLRYAPKEWASRAVG